MNENYRTVRLSRDWYKGELGFGGELERLDPSGQYQGSELAGYDAFQRQLKRFDIKVSGADSDRLQKFFSTADSAALFPEYVSRAVRQGVEEDKILEEICAARTGVGGLDYRTITSDPTREERELKVVEEGGFIPETTIRLRENLVRLHKRGRMLVASYEAVKYQRIQLFTVALRQIGGAIGQAQLRDAVRVLLEGDSGEEPAKRVALATPGELQYDDLLRLWNEFEEYEMNVMLAAPDMVLKLLKLPEMQSPAAGLDFQGSGRLSTPLGARLIRCGAVPAGKIIGLDRRFALEMAVAGEVSVEHDKLIDCQLERAAVTCTAGFSKLFPDAVRVLE